MYDKTSEGIWNLPCYVGISVIGIMMVMPVIGVWTYFALANYLWQFWIYAPFVMMGTLIVVLSVLAAACDPARPAK